jgi:hypothetical protein
MAENITKEEFKELVDMVKAFKNEFDLTMNGDKNSDNGGRRGVVSNIRTLLKSPSLLWLLRNKTVPTASAIYVTHALLHFLEDKTVDLLDVIIKYFSL